MTIFATAAMQLSGLSTRPVYLAIAGCRARASFHAREDSVYFHQNKMLSVAADGLQNFRRYGIDEKQVALSKGTLSTRYQSYVRA